MERDNGYESICSMERFSSEVFKCSTQGKTQVANLGRSSYHVRWAYGIVILLGGRLGIFNGTHVATCFLKLWNKVALF